MSQEVILPPPSLGHGENGRRSGWCCSNECLHNSPQWHWTTAPLCCFLPIPPFYTLTLKRRLFFFFFSGGCGCLQFWSSYLLPAHSYFSALLHSLPSPSSALPCSLSPSPPALASNSLNRLASCQSRGLLWLCHKSARKNRNHLFRLGPGRG